VLHAQAGSGIVFGHLTDDLTLARLDEMLKGLLEESVAAKGNLIVTRCPSAWKRALPVWGRPGSDIELMRQVKEQLDPRRLFNPGRFIDGTSPP
jgi:glycolate oxidase FAD binding subunit